MSPGPALNVLCEHLRSRTGGHVAVGKPDAGKPGVYVWPWRLVPDASVKNLPPKPPGSGRRPVDPTFAIHFLLLATADSAIESLSQLVLARQELIENPVLVVDGDLANLIPDANLVTADLTAVFIAARLELALCFPFVLKGLGHG